MEQGTSSHQPPPGAQPDEDSLPATKGDVRDLRRWVIVAGVWAVAASVIAIVALFSGDDGSEPSSRRSGDDSAQIARLQRTLDNRIDDLESKIEELPTSGDLSRLEGRLGEVEDQASEAANSAKDASDKVSELEARVEDLETAQPQGSGGTTTPDEP